MKSLGESWSGGEERLAKILEKEGYDIEKNKQFGKYIVDIYVSDIHVAMEFDGKGWHNFKKKDEKRDDYLREIHFLPVLRIKHFGVDYLFNIRSFCDLWSISAVERKRKYLDYIM